jgi:hypothetical protein
MGSGQDVSLVSSTDSPEEVQAALAETPVEKKTDPPAGDKPATDKPATDTPAADKPATDKVADPAPDAGTDGAETPTQRAEKASQSARARREAKIQSEIDKKIATREAARRDAEAEEARLAQLRADRAALEAEIALKKATPGTGDTPAQETPKPVLHELNADGTPKYANYEEWVDAVGQWHAAKATITAEQQRLKDKKESEQAERDRVERARLTRAEQNAVASYETKLDTFKTSTPDFDATLAAAQEAVQEIVDDLGDGALNVIDRYTVHDADHGPAIIHYLAQHPDEMRRIAEMPVPKQLAHLGRLDERLAAASPSAPARTERPPVSSAPDPISPVGGSPTSSTVPLEEESYQAYKARRDREERASRGR